MGARSFNKENRFLGSYEIETLLDMEQIANVEPLQILYEDDTKQTAMDQKVNILLDKNEVYNTNSGRLISGLSSNTFLVTTENKKKYLHSVGLYDPGSYDVCTAYIAVSNSEVVLHPWHLNPKVTDPGLRKILHDTEDDKHYPDDGQQLYLNLCKEMNIVPVRRFHDGLMTRKIDITYCGINPVGVRAMCLALYYNMIVEEFILADNFLTLDACYHLGCMIRDNRNLLSLDLTGCRIGPEGVRRLCKHLADNGLLQSLNLTYNNLGKEGTIIFSELLQGNMTLKRLNLSHNKIGPKAVIELANCLECGNTLTHLNLAWNNLFSPYAMTILMKVLADSSCLQEIDLSWNCLTGARVGNSIKKLLQIPTLTVLNLSNNRLRADALREFIAYLHIARKLNTLNLSFNPLSDVDAYNTLAEFSRIRVRIQYLLFDNIWVNQNFVKLLTSLKVQNRYHNLVVTYEGVHNDYNIKNVDMRQIVMKRAMFLTRRHSKKKDFGQFIMVLQNKSNMISIEDFIIEIETKGIILNGDLITEIANAFPYPSMGDKKRINLKGMVEYIHRLWPSTTLPVESTPSSASSKATRKSFKMNKSKVKNAK